MNTSGADIIFPHLGISIEHIVKSFTIGGKLTIAFYGVLIAAGMLLGLWYASRDFKRKGGDPEMVSDYAILAIIFGVIGARLYYVIFEWSNYRADTLGQTLLNIINIRQGGLAIYGAVAAGAITALIFCRKKKYPFFRFVDSILPGVLIGQILGRWGNFINCEAFGGYTDGLFAMRIKESVVNNSYMITQELKDHLIIENGVRYIQVHPTFLYESFWNLLSFLFLFWFARKKQKKDGQIFFLYFLLYGVGRFFIEGLRTDCLMIPGTSLPVSQVLSAVLAVASVIGLIILSRRPESPAAVCETAAEAGAEGCAAEAGAGVEKLTGAGVEGDVPEAGAEVEGDVPEAGAETMTAVENVEADKNREIN